MITEIDAIDRTLLSALQGDLGIAIAELAHRTGLSVASVQRRLKRLREARVIEREVAVLNPAALGQTMTFIVMVELERERPDQLQAFREAALKEPHVQQCYYVTGEADFVLICLAPDMAGFEQLAQRLFASNANVRRFRTSVAMARAKVGLTVPL
ncbi:MAG: Lrp/AsnC family transcriptional regulator [Alphaproteobacteria bacterium]|nr:Lrp/AsnC family transcriptional regulator [Alphaproteobacteria bacterium]